MVIDGFAGNASITNVAFDASGANAFFATSDGVLRALSGPAATDTTVGDVGPGAWSLALYAPSGQMGVVNGMLTDESGNVLDAGGVTLTSISVSSSAKGARLDVGSPSKSEPSRQHISRPCGLSAWRN